MNEQRKKQLMQLAEVLGTREAVRGDIERREEELEKIQIRYQQSKNAHRSVDEYIKESQRVMSGQELSDALDERREARADIETIGEELRGAQIAIKQLQKKRRDLGTETEGMLESMGASVVDDIKLLAIASLDEHRALLNLRRAELERIASKHDVNADKMRETLDDFSQSLGQARTLFI